ncbi:MAG: tRNA pseudouridine(55) synthase TruB [Isosphaeraceae bacterium]
MNTIEPTDAPLRGFLNLNKPQGITSRDVVDLIARPLRRRKIKAGHAGTLDPLATGVLVVALGAATRLVSYVQAQAKTYRAVVRLGATSSSDDADGAITETPNPPIPTRQAVIAALQSQVGTILQQPPIVSALKVEGRRAYDLARKGEAIDLAPRPVRIDRIECLAYEWPILNIEVDCGSGTYIRSIARDVGQALGCGGLIERLERTRIGPFRIEEAADPRMITPDSLPALLQPMARALQDFPTCRLDPEQAKRVSRGQSLAIDRLEGGPLEPGEVGLLGADGELIAIGEVSPGRETIQPRKVLSGD